MSTDRIPKKFGLTVPIPSPQPNRVSGLGSTTPSQWDPNWQYYTDLSPAQITAYKAMPQWAVLVQGISNAIAS